MTSTTHRAAGLAILGYGILQTAALRLAEGWMHIGAILIVIGGGVIILDAFLRAPPAARGGYQPKRVAPSNPVPPSRPATQSARAVDFESTQREGGWN